MHVSISTLSKIIALGTLAAPAWAETPIQTVTEDGVVVSAYAPNDAINDTFTQQNNVARNIDAIRITTANVATATNLIAAHHGLVPHISDAARGEVSNLLLTGSVQNMMSLIETEASIDWFVYGGVLEVSARGETQTRFIPLGGLDIERVARILIEAEIDPDRLGLIHIADGNAVRVSGPPKAVEVVEAILSLAEREAPIPRPHVIVVRRGTAKSAETYGEAAIAQLFENVVPVHTLTAMQSDDGRTGANEN